MKHLGCKSRLKELGSKHLTLALDTGKAEILQEAFNNVIEAQGGVKVMAKKAGMSLGEIKRTLADKESFQLLVDISKIVSAFSTFINQH